VQNRKSNNFFLNEKRRCTKFHRSNLSLYNIFVFKILQIDTLDFLRARLEVAVRVADERNVVRDESMHRTARDNDDQNRIDFKRKRCSLSPPSHSKLGRRCLNKKKKKKKKKQHSKPPNAKTKHSDQYMYLQTHQSLSCSATINPIILVFRLRPITKLPVRVLRRAQLRDERRFFCTFCADRRRVCRLVNWIQYIQKSGENEQYE
jgi:hypothetical protein